MYFVMDGWDLMGINVDLYINCMDQMFSRQGQVYLIFLPYLDNVFLEHGFHKRSPSYFKVHTAVD